MGELRFDGKVAIVTGAGNGLGRAHALLLGARGTKVVVNDLGGGMHGGGKSSAAADQVVAQIREAGGEAVANYDSVEDGAQIVKTALDSFGRLDIVVNNAGILRDVSFHKMTQEDWDLVYRVHVLGAFRVTHAAWPHLRDQGYGRIVMTASAAGIYGNFGQANYAMAKLGLVGFANTLAVEGRKKGVLVNTIAPIAGSRLTETILPKEVTEALKPEYVSPLVAWLCHEDCDETGGLFEVGGGYFGKLRWERAAGVLNRVGRNTTPEDVQRSWSKIAGFEKSEHPGSVGESMQPIMTNIQAGPSKGGNQYIDVDQALGYEFPEFKTRYDERDLALYALGVGAAANPLDEKELGYVYELHSGGFSPLPTYAVVPAVNGILKMAKEGNIAPGLNYGLDRILHGEQYTEVKRPLPPNAELTHRTRIKDIFDKGKGALVITETKSYDDDGDLLIVNENTVFVRGAGGWGGDRGPSAEVNAAPDRAPDATIEETIGNNQALLYRLSGDWNPLHADPSFAKAFGFERPILHGLCTFGYAGRHVINSFSGGDPRKFKSIKVRFADTVFPGETLKTEMWKESDTKVVFRCSVKERDKVVISNAAIELYTEIPKKVAKKVASETTASSAAPATPNSDDVFAAIGKHIETHPDLVGQVKKVFQFRLNSPESVWTIDVKNDAGSVGRGETAKPDTTLDITDSDFMDMCTGKADAQKLYFGGKLKIGGDLMASQRLEFLKKLDPQLVIEAMKARGGGSGATKATPAPAAAAEPDSVAVFLGIGVWIDKHPELAEKIQTVFEFTLTDPRSVWTIDLKNGKGTVIEGKADDNDVTLTLSESDFVAMTRGEADPQKLYFAGKLKIGGNVMASQKLSFLQKIDKDVIAGEVTERLAARASSGAPKPKAAPSRAPIATTLMRQLQTRFADNTALAGDVQATIQLLVTEPEASWVIDCKSGPGEVREGRADGATATFSIADEDLEALAKGEVSPQDLHQRGKLRIDGDVAVAHRLGFLKLS